MPETGATNWPAADTFQTPGSPSTTPQSTGGDAARALHKLLADIGAAWEAMRTDGRWHARLHGLTSVSDHSAATTDLDLANHKLTSVADGTAVTDGATWGQVQALINGLDWTHPAARVVATSNITLSGTQTIDGVAAIAGDRVLAAGQSTGSQNGIYVVASGAWARATDADTSAEVPPGMAVVVNEGTVNGDTVWVLTTNAPITLGSTALAFAELPTPNALLAGAGLTRTANTINAVANADASITVNADDIQVAALGITTGKLAAGAVTSAKVDSSVEVVANKGANSGYMGLDSAGRGNQPPKVHDLRGPDHIDLTAPTGQIGASAPLRWTAWASNNNLLSQRLQMQGLVLPAGVPIEFLSFFSGSGGPSGISNQWFALFDKSRNRLAVSADDLTTAWGATAEKKLALSRTVTDAAITTGTATLTSATAAFTSADTGRRVTVLGAGAAGVPLGTSAAPVTMTYVNATTVTLSANAGTTVSGATAYIGTRYTPPSTDLYYAAILVNASTISNYMFASAGASVFEADPPIYAGTADSGLTTPATCPSGAASLTAVASIIACKAT